MGSTTLLQNLFAPGNRLYALESDGALVDLAVEARLGREALFELFEWRIIVALLHKSTLNAEPPVSVRSGDTHGMRAGKRSHAIDTPGWIAISVACEATSRAHRQAP
ncbi:hypothetical protein LMG19083_04764 [Ralstonia psammae]|uniref:Uncharacterized protein n=1 Tax=Ralstonia psammae TaxID=3058598 RepID=A0ABM9K0G5_9RALS|nr:hypothetical protein LMG19083_04764 [Ralstonia sp. LMG 19083]